MKPVTRTKGSHLPSAEICRRNGWKRGTVIEGEEHEGFIDRARITAIGEREILAIFGDPDDVCETQMDLTGRNWKRVKP